MKKIFTLLLSLLPACQRTELQTSPTPLGFLRVAPTFSFPSQAPDIYFVSPQEGIERELSDARGIHAKVQKHLEEGTFYIAPGRDRNAGAPSLVYRYPEEDFSFRLSDDFRSSLSSGEMALEDTGEKGYFALLSTSFWKLSSEEESYAKSLGSYDAYLRFQDEASYEEFQVLLS